MADAVNVIAGLPLFAWRGIEVPCESAPYDGGHDLAERRYPYRDGASHDPTGRVPYTGTARLIFGNLYGKGPGGRFLYPDTWTDFHNAMRDKSPGKLRHPDLGEMDAKIARWHVALNSQNRGGITVDVEWTETILDITKPPQPSLSQVGVVEIAKAADAAAAAFGISYPTGQSYTTISGAVAAVDGLAFSASLTVSGIANQVAGTLDSMLSKIEALNNAEAWPAYDNILAVWAKMRDIADRQAALVAKATSKTTTVSETTFDALATLTGNSVDDLMGLNVGLLRSPTIPRGTVVQFYS